MATSKNEADVIFNRANVSLARSQRLIASWLPPVTPDELSNAKSEEELQKEEDGIFTAVPEKLGLGAPLPKKAADGSWERTELSSNDKLRKQLLGRNYEKMNSKLAMNAGKQQGGSTPRPQPSEPRNQENDTDDDDEGRSSLGRNKRKRAVVHDQPDAEEAADRKPGSAKKTGSYLDELLSQRSKKNKKKKT